MSWLNNIKGIVRKNEPLAPYTTLKIGGVADIFIEPENLEDLANIVKYKPVDMPITVLGKGSNVLISDKGIRGIVVHMENCCDKVEVNGHKIYAEAGAASGKVARSAREVSLTGAEFLCGIPGSVGGALKMNAGAYGHETMPIVESVELITDEGELVTKTPDEIGYSYRKTNIPDGWMYAAATFVLEAGDKDEIRNQMRQINKDRSTSQPLKMPSSGSWFKNVVHDDGSRTNAWKIVDEAGCRGLQLGGAQVSEKHSNFFVNAGGATASEMMELTDKVEQIIKEKLGITIQREVRLIGEK